MSELAQDGHAEGRAIEADEQITGRLGRRNDRLMIVGVLLYAFVVVFLMFVRGLSITPDVMAVAFGLAAVLLGRGRLFLRDWIPFIALFLAYELMRGLADNVGFHVHIASMALADSLITFGHIPTVELQHLLHPATGVDYIAWLATIVYMLHFVLPLFTAFVLWLWRRAQYYDYVAALILLSLWGFVTFVLIPAAPPWYAAQSGALNGPNGLPLISYLKPTAFDQLAKAVGFNGSYLYTYTFYDVNPNGVAAWPSLHVGYPFLSFLVLRRAFGRVGWIAFFYSLLVAFSVMYTGDHWLVDCLGGVAYAYVSYYAIVHAPAVARRMLARARNDSLEWQGAGPGLQGVLVGQRAGIAWPGLVLGVVVAIVGVGGVQAMEHAADTATPLFLAAWGVLLAGLCIAAWSLVRR